MKRSKKGFAALIVCLCLLAGLMSGQTLTVFAAEEKTVLVQGFESFSNDVELKKGVPVWEEGGILELSLSTSIKNDGKNAIKMVPKGPNGSQPWASITVPVEKGKTDWTGADEIQFYVKNVGDTYLSFQVNLTEGNGEAWALKATGTAQIATTAPGKFQEVKCDYNVITVPAGFAGLVKVPFGSFEVASWFTGESKNDKLELGDMATLSFGFSAVDNKDKSIYVDSFAIAGAGLKASEPAKAVDAAEVKQPAAADAGTGENPKTGDAGTLLYLMLGGVSGGLLLLGRKRMK